tara:strand:- start:94 stop:474 length:381 start_codon:yes stop_codon:yes gene_type:complete
MINNKLLTIYCIYDANGSIAGEFSYLIRKLFFGFKCSMCDITHNTFTEKPNWRSKVSETGFNIKALHLDEQTNELSNFSIGKTPCVIGKNGDEYKLIFDNNDLGKFKGDTEYFFKELTNKIKKIFI